LTVLQYNLSCLYEEQLPSVNCVPSPVGNVRRRAELHESWIETAWSDIFLEPITGSFQKWFVSVWVEQMIICCGRN